MCAPTSSGPSAAADASVATRRGFLYGVLSLFFAVTAGSATMGHNQSRRDSLGCDSMCIGSMTSARSTLTLLGATLIGKLSDSTRLDKLGGARKFVLLLGIAASGLELLVTSQATMITHLWISMIPSALLNHNFTVLKALFGDYHSSSATAAERAGSVGKLGMAAGFAFMLGPLASSTFLSTYSEAAMFSAFSLCLALVFVCLLPAPKNTQEKSTETKDHTTEKPPSLWRKLVPDFVPAARTPPALFIMTARLCMVLAFHIFQTIWTVVLKQRFNFGPKEYGRYFGFIGLFYAFSQGFLAKFLIQRFGSTTKGRARLLLLCCLILGGGRMFVYQTNSLTSVYAIYCLIITALGVVNTIFTADTSKLASPEELGGLFGVLSSVESLAGIVGPILGGALSKIHPEQGPLMAVLFLYGVVFTNVYWGYDRFVGGTSAEIVAKKVS
jgi:hypothetical protein